MKGARELDHAPIVSSGRFRSASKQGAETYVSFKVEGSQRARSHPSRTDKWHEDFEITVDKANEVEIAVFDKQAGEAHPVLIGLLWIQINDLVEALRRQKVHMESGQRQWLPADAMGGEQSPSSALFSGQTGAGGLFPQMGYGDMNSPVSFGGGPGGMMGRNMDASAQVEGIDAWFSVEPAGALALRLNFGSSLSIIIILFTNAHTSAQ